MLWIKIIQHPIYFKISHGYTISFHTRHQFSTDCFRLSVVNSSTNSYIRSFLILKGNILRRMNETNEGTHALATKRFHLSTVLQKNPVGVALFLHHALTDSLISHVNWMLRCTVARVIDFAFSFFFAAWALAFSKIDR